MEDKTVTSGIAATHAMNVSRVNGDQKVYGNASGIYMFTANRRTAK